MDQFPCFPSSSPNGEGMDMPCIRHSSLIVICSKSSFLTSVLHMTSLLPFIKGITFPQSFIWPGNYHVAAHKCLSSILIQVLNLARVLTQPFLKVYCKSNTWTAILEWCVVPMKHFHISWWGLVSTLLAQSIGSGFRLFHFKSWLAFSNIRAKASRCVGSKINLIVSK